MFGRLFLLFTVIPLVELYLLIKVGEVIGALNTILLIIATGLLGAFLAKLEGLRTLNQIQQNLNQGIMPAEELLDGVIILVAGLMLITPGIMTDICGFLLLVPQTRFAFKRWLRRRFDRIGGFRERAHLSRKVVPAISDSSAPSDQSALLRLAIPRFTGHCQ